MGKTFTKSNTTNDIAIPESYEEHESNIDFFLINSLENMTIIIGLIAIIVFAIYLIINYIKRKREEFKSIKNNKVYNNKYNNSIHNDYNIFNNNINNVHDINKGTFPNKNKKWNQINNK